MTVFTWRDADVRLERAFTSRHGGVSLPPFDTLNLGHHVGDDPEAVGANRARLAEALRLPHDHLVFMDQQHGTDVAFVQGPGPAGPADAMVTTRTDLALAVLVADCVPVLLHDLEAGVIGVAHAGRPGFLSGVVDRAVAGMRAAGATSLTAVVGPSVCGRCYEVPEDLRRRAAAVVPESAAVSWRGTPAIDIATGVVTQLRDQGVTTTWLPGCSRESDGLFSYRRDHRTGRAAGVIVRRSS